MRFCVYDVAISISSIQQKLVACTDRELHVPHVSKCKRCIRLYLYRAGETESRASHRAGVVLGYCSNNNDDDYFDEIVPILMTRESWR